MLDNFWRRKYFPVFLLFAIVAFALLLRLVGSDWGDAMQTTLTIAVSLVALVFIGQKLGYFMEERNNPYANKWVRFIAWVLFLVWVAHFFVRG